MCMKTGGTVKHLGKPPPAPEPPPEEIQNAEGSVAEEQKKKKKGKKEFVKDAAGLQIGTVSNQSPSSPNVG